jgi:hypothetical protein
LQPAAVVIAVRLIQAHANTLRRIISDNRICSFPQIVRTKAAATQCARHLIRIVSQCLSRTEGGVLPDSSSSRLRSADLLSPLLVPWLFLSSLIAHDALIGSMAAPRLTACCRLRLRLRHALLATMLAALILHTFPIVFSKHRDHTLFLQRFPDEQA